MRRVSVLTALSEASERQQVEAETSASNEIAAIEFRMRQSGVAHKAARLTDEQKDGVLRKHVAQAQARMVEALIGLTR